MVPYRIVNLTQGTSTWLDWRDQGIGASDASSIIGENPWKSRESLLHEKIHGLRFAGNAATRRGTALEPEARNRFEQLTGIPVRPVCLEHLHHPWHRASIDGLAHDGRHVVEIKCGQGVYGKTCSTRRVPKYYFAQLQHILSVTGLPEIHFWCYMPGRSEVHLLVERDDTYISSLMEGEMEFWQELVGRREGNPLG